MNGHSLTLAAFWLGLLLLFHTFLGYALCCLLLARLFPKPPPPESVPPDITVVLVAHNEESRLAARIENLLASDYPPEKMRVLLVSDGSTDGTGAFSHARVTTLARGERSGKAACLNAGVASCESEVIVFADARQRFAPDTIARLAAHFADPAVGAVSGALEIEAAQSSVGHGVDWYWRSERFLRTTESRFDSCIGCTGAVYAMRRALFTPIPDDTILDDVVIPMQIAQRGARVVFDPNALAFDPQPLEPGAERIRKRRTLAGNWQMLFRHPAWLTPWGHRLWWQLISHKYLRLAAPWLLALVFAANAALLAAPFYRAVFVAQLAFYTLAAIGRTFPMLRSPLFAIPAGFVFLNARAASALWHYLRGSDLQRWPRATPPTPRQAAG